MTARKHLPATLARLRKGQAIFYVPKRKSRVYDLGRPLPIPARVRVPMEVGAGEIIPVGTAITVVQAEIVDGVDVLIGFRFGDGAEEGLCMLDEIELL